MGYVYMQITEDKYQLPLAVADTPAELGRIIGKNGTTIECYVSRLNHGKIKSKYPKYIKVRIKDER